MKILLVDDEPVNQEVAKDMLEILGCEVVIANNGQEAVEASADEVFDLILMDCRMPVMNGLEATKQIRTTEGNANQSTKIVALSGGDKQDELAECVEAGMNDYICKPYSLANLKALVQGED